MFAQNGRTHVPDQKGASYSKAASSNRTKALGELPLAVQQKLEKS